MRTVTIDTTDQTLRLFAYDSNSDAVTGLTSGSAGLAVNVIVRQEGIKTGTTDITGSLTTRDTAATHKDYSFTEIGSGEYELDLPDSFFTSAQVVTATIAATAITGRSYSTTITVDAAQSQLVDRAGYTMAVLTGAISDADTTTNTFAVTIDGVTYTVTNNGVGTDGDRTAPTLAKA